MTLQETREAAARIMQTRHGFPVKIKTTARAQRKYGVHAGQVVEVDSVFTWKGKTHLYAVCEDEHELRLSPSDVDEVKA